MGYYCSKYKADEKVIGWYWFLGSLLILSSALLMGGKFGLQASRINTQPIVFPLIFVAGIIFINFVAHKITDTRIGKLFATIGDFSFTIMALHFVGFKIVTYIRTFFDPAVILSSFPVDRREIAIWMPVYVIVGIAFPICILMIFQKLKDVRNRNRILQEY